VLSHPKSIQELLPFQLQSLESTHSRPFGLHPDWSYYSLPGMSKKESRQPQIEKQILSSQS